MNVPCRQSGKTPFSMEEFCMRVIDFAIEGVPYFNKSGEMSSAPDGFFKSKEERKFNTNSSKTLGILKAGCLVVARFCIHWVMKVGNWGRVGTKFKCNIKNTKRCKYNSFSKNP